MKSISDFKKRIVTGQKIKLSNCDNPNHKYLGMVRTISKVQTNGFYMATDEQLSQGKNGSWLDFPKLSGVLEFKENGII